MKTLSFRISVESEVVMKSNQQLHVLCNHKCLPYVFSNPISKKYMSVFLNLDLHKIVKNSRFLSPFINDDAFHTCLVISDTSFLYHLATNTLYEQSIPNLFSFHRRKKYEKQKIL